MGRIRNSKILGRFEPVFYKKFPNTVQSYACLTHVMRTLILLRKIKTASYYKNRNRHFRHGKFEIRILSIYHAELPIFL